jgi:hypothetical protein
MNELSSGSLCIVRRQTMANPFRILTGMGLLIFSICALAQTNVTGYIFGRVLLESGEPASSALVTIENAQTGLQRALPAREDGSFRFPALPIGSYSILIEAAGFVSAEQKELAVNVAFQPNRKNWRSM